MGITLTNLNGCLLGPAHEVSEGNKDSVRNWDRDHLALNLASFCPCPKNLNEAEFEGHGLICLSEEIPRQDATQAGMEEAAALS